MKSHLTISSVLLCSWMVTGCMSAGSTAKIDPAQSPKSLCQTSQVKLDTDFPAGNIASCLSSGQTRLDVTLAPEDAPPINCSAWYAFRLTPSRPGSITVNLNYEACGHRYWPKISEDGAQWDYLPKKNVTIEEVDGLKRARITVNMDTKPVFVAGQEIFPPSTYRAWLDTATRSPDATQWLLGKSAEGRNIPAMTVRASGVKPKEQVVLVGRQHPPEVTGALAMLPFVEALLSDQPLAKKYRTRFETVVVPMLNPDGVVRGYWRHNTGSTDLNRDWGPFKQPETQLMNKLLKDLADDPNRTLRFFVDFHSTQKDVFYTIPDRLPSDPPNFLKNWLNRYQDRMGDYKVNIQPSKNLDQANSKNYVYKTYGVPAVTFELGDETDRQQIGTMAREAAIAMMETLLATKAQ